jgi:metal-responsive CopG/Arc/MetJ family transcriptional regulator
VHEDEARALDERAKKERTSKSEIIRRALRAYLGIED